MAGRAGRLGTDFSATSGCGASKEGLSQIGTITSDDTKGRNGVELELNNGVELELSS